MKTHCPWLSLLAHCTLLVAASALVFAIVIAGASVALAGHQSAEVEETQTAAPKEVAPLTQSPSVASSFSGMVTDSHCGARHKRNSTHNAIDCAHACVRKGATYVLVDGYRRYTLIGNDPALAQLAGERANIAGTRQGDTIIVHTVAPAF